MNNWNDYSIDEIMANIEEPNSCVVDDDQFSGYIAGLLEEILESPKRKPNKALTEVCKM